MTIGERIRIVRKQRYNMTQEEFAELLNVSRSNLGNVETGRIEATDRLILDICRVFGINEDWLRNGKGDIFRQLSETDKLMQAIAMVETSNDSLIKGILIAYSELSDEKRAIIREIVENVVEHTKEFEKEKKPPEGGSKK